MNPAIESEEGLDLSLPTDAASQARPRLESFDSLATRKRLLFVAAHQERVRALEDAFVADYELHSVLAPEDATDVLRAADFDLVLVDADACCPRLLSDVAARGLSKRCVVLARVLEVESVIETYATQHVFRVFSSDAGADDLRAFVRSAVFPREADRRVLSGIDAQLRMFDGRVLTCCLLDLSHHGMAVRLDASEGLLLPDTPIQEVRLVCGSVTKLHGVPAIARYVEALGGDGHYAYKVGIEFRVPAGPRPADSGETISDPVRLRSILRDGVHRGLTLRLADTSTVLARDASASLDGATNGIRIQSPSPAELQVGDVVEARFDLAGSSHTFLASVRDIDPDASRGYSLRLPRAVRVLRQRRSARVRPPPDRPVELGIVSPFVGGLSTRPATNITGLGAAFELSDEDLLPVGTEIPRLTLRFHDGTELYCGARVRSITRMPAKDGVYRATCGVEFTSLSSIDRARLADAIVHAGRPTLRDGTGTPLEALWSFLLETRFLYPEKLKLMSVEEVQETLRRLLEHPNDVFKTMLVVNDARIEGHASAVRVYEKTWVLQHLAAKAAGKSTMTRGRVLNLAVIEYLEQLPGIEWVKIWFRPTNRWPAKVFGGFARKIQDPSLSDLRTFAYLASPTWTPRLRVPGVEVRPGNQSDAGLVESYFVSRRQSVPLRSDDLTGAGLELAGVRTAFDRLGLTRKRELLVAERGGRPVGFALLEISSPGLNFSELTNTFRTFQFGSDSEAQRALIAAARERYRELGFARCIALAQADVDVFQSLGFEHAKDYSCWTWHRSQYQAFCEHVLKLRM